MNWHYLLFHLTIVFSLIISWKLDKQFLVPKLKPAFKLILVSQLPIILLDFLVSGWWWEFNPSFVINIRLYSLPIEEVLFFFTVPYALLILAINLQQRVIKRKKLKVSPWVHRLAITSLLIVSGISLSNQWWYSLGMTVWLVILWIIALKRNLFQRKLFWVMAGSTLGLTLIFNMYLTALPIVVYNQTVKSGLLIGTIPIEDFLFALIMIFNMFLLKEKAWINLLATNKN